MSTTAPKSASWPPPSQNEPSVSKAKAKSKAESYLKKLPQNGEFTTASAPPKVSLSKATSKGTNESYAPAKSSHSESKGSGWKKSNYNSTGPQKERWGSQNGAQSGGGGGGGWKWDDWGPKRSNWRPPWGSGDWHESYDYNNKNNTSSDWNTHTNDDVHMGGDGNGNTSMVVSAPTVAPTSEGKATTSTLSGKATPGTSTLSGKATPGTSTLSGKATSGTSTLSGKATPGTSTLSGKASSGTLGKATSKSSSEAKVPPKSKAAWQQPASKPKSIGPQPPLNPQPQGLAANAKKVIPGNALKQKITPLQQRNAAKAKAQQQLRKMGPGGPGVPPAGLRSVNSIGKTGKMGNAGRFAPLRQTSKVGSVPKIGKAIINSKAPTPMKFYPKSCVCGNLTDTTYYVQFMSNQSYCSKCWEKLEEPMGFMQSLEQMKRLGALCLNQKIMTK